MSEYGSDANITGSLIVDGETDIGSGDDDIDLDAGTLFVDADNDRVGIGTSSPLALLHVSGGQTFAEVDKYAGPVLTLVNDGDNQYRYGMTIQAGTDDGTCTRGVWFKDGNDDEVGYINWSGGTVTYATFTGAHEAAVSSEDYTPGQNAYDYGAIVKIVSTSAGARQKQVEYVITQTTTAEDKAALGVYSQNMDPDEVEKSNSHQVFALGDGHVLVCNAGGDIEIGDYICSSATEGHGKKQSDDLLHSYTVAKATEAIIWANESGTTKLISCTYHAS